METILVLDADSALGHALCRELRRRDYGVIAHVRGGGEPFEDGIVVVSTPRADAALAAWSEGVAKIDHVVFGQPSDRAAFDAPHDFERLAAALEERLDVFLAELQAAGKLLARGNGGQIWVITQEDSMHYYTGTESLPIDSRARHAAVKSFAKEMFRFGVRVNCANVQLISEQASTEQWQRARDGLKTFAMRFRPNGAAAVAEALWHFIAQPALPMAGMVIPVGVGFAENSI